MRQLEQKREEDIRLIAYCLKLSEEDVKESLRESGCSAYEARVFVLIVGRLPTKVEYNNGIRILGPQRTAIAIFNSEHSFILKYPK